MRTNQYIKEINKFSQQLSEDNQSKLNKIVLKLRFSKIEDKQAEEFGHHCLDLFLQAEEEQKTIEEIIGTTDIEKFCDEFIKETKENYSVFEKLYLRIKYLPLVLLIFTGIFEMFVGTMVRNLLDSGFSLSIPITISIIVDTVIAYIFLHVFLSKINIIFEILNENNAKQNRMLNVLLLIFYMIMIGIFVLSKLFLRTVLFHINFLVFMIIVGAVCIAQYYFDEHGN